MAMDAFRIGKDPDAVLPYSIDWSDWLVSGDTIATSTWAAETGITVDSDSETTQVTTVVLSGGTVGETYRVRNRIVTANGYTDDRSIWVTVCEN